MNRRAGLSAAAVVVVLAVLPWLHAAPQDRPPLEDAPPAVRAALQDGDYGKALELLGELAKSQPERADLWLLLRGFVQNDRRDPAAAEQALAELETRFPQSTWRIKARLARAEALRQLRRYAEAEAIVAAEATRLLSEPRRRELAAIAVKLADERLDPKKDEHGQAPPPDEAGALDLYGRILELDPPGDVVAHVQRQRGVALERLKKFDEAVAAFQKFLAGVKQDVVTLDSADARIHLGRSLLALSRHGEARRTFEDLATALSATTDAELLTRRGDALAAVAATWNQQDADGAPLAVAALRRFLEQCPRHPGTWSAGLDVARIWNGIGRLDDAIAALDALLARPEGEAAEKRDELLRTKADAAFLRGQLLLRQGKPELASASFSDCIARDPTGPNWAQAQAAMVECEYQVSRVARTRRDFAGARAALAGFIGRHPLDGRIAAIRFEIGELFSAEADAKRDPAGAKPSPETQAAMHELRRSAIEEWQRLARIHAGSNEASEGLFRAGLLYHDELGELDRALETWRACSFGPRAGEAAARLREMTTPALSLSTERTWRTDEPARVRLRVRNVPEVKLELHRLDLEAYFRKFLALDGVEELDLDLIAPEKTVTVKVDGYARLKDLVQEVPVEMDGPGAWVVAAVAEGQRATTLLLRSDLDFVVKSSRGDLLVFAQDVRAGKVAADVEIFADLGEGPAGARRQVQGKTGADGVFHARLEDLAAAPAVRALARRQGHFAASGVDLAGFAATAPLTPRGVVFTDRPAYHPGDDVRARVLLREPRDGRLSFEPGSKWRVDLVDPRGRLTRSSDLLLGDFGTLAASFQLDALAPVGPWTVRASRPDGPTFSGGFVVAEFELDRINVDLTLPRRVFYRGEPIELDATARWQHGAPLVDAALRFTLPDGQLTDLRTDATGHAHARFETRDQPSEALLQFAATLTEEGVTSSASAFLAVREFGLGLTLPSRAVLADERFSVEVAATLRDGTPLSREAKLTLLRRDPLTGGEVKVLERAVTTDEKGGRGRVELSLPAGGSHVVRVEAVDRFGNPIGAEGSLEVSGADDAVRLRLLADRAALEAGEKTTVRLVNRAGAGLLLLTWENDAGLRWKVIDVADGTKDLEVVADDLLVPGFVLAASAMRGPRLHVASVPFRVTRELKLSVTARTSPAQPGGETTVDLLATDPLGRPVVAELSLAVIDDALLRLFADPTPPLAGVFRMDAAPPQPHRTDSSCSFSYEGETRTIAAAVLAEARRAAAEQQWQSERGQLAGQLRALGSEADDRAAPQEAEKKAFADAELEDRAQSDSVGAGGGARGFFGGRRGGQNSRPGGRASAAGDFAETAFFSPSIVTGADGRASVTFKLPGQATKYRLVVRGITKDTRAGDASGELVAKSDFAVELRLPPLLVEGDAPRLLARVFHAPEISGTAELRLRVTQGDQVLSLPATIGLGSGEVVEHLFEALPPIRQVDRVGVELVASAKRGDALVENRFSADVAVRPWGLELTDARGGELARGTTLFLELPSDRPWLSRRLDLFLSPSAQRFLVDEALERTPFELAPKEDARALTQADAAGELFGVCGVLELVPALVSAQAAGSDDVIALRARASALLARLVATQQQDGGWPWAGPCAASNQSASDAPTSGLALVALGRARVAGLEVPGDVVDAALRFVEQAFRAAPQQADELKALLQFGLALHGRADFGALNRLHRARTGLSPAALAYVTLALFHSGKEPMAAEVASFLEQRAEPFGPAGAAGVAGAAACRWDVTANAPWNRSRLEMAALAVLALESAAPKSTAVERGVQYLLQQRPWAPMRAAGVVWAALARYYSSVVPERSEALVRVRVNDRELEAIRLAPGLAATHVAVPADLIGEGRVKVELALEGRARPSFLAALRGFTPAVKRRDLPELRVTRHALLTPPPIERGRPLPTGFTVLTETPKDVWENPVTELPAGALADVQLSCLLNRNARSPEEFDHFVLDVPLPAGVDVVDGSARGDFLSFRKRPGGIVFELGRRGPWANVAFSLLGRVAGEWRVLPPTLRSSYDADVTAHGDPHTLKVVPRGEAGKDPYRPTPDELYHRGKRAFDAGDNRSAGGTLDRLLSEFGEKLRDEPFRDVARMLLFIHLEAGDAARIVRSFEVLKEKDPDFTLGFEPVLKVGAAYRAIEEHERALLLERALIDETFGKDLKASGLLSGAGRFKESFALLERLWLEYPDSPGVLQSYLALSDEMLTRAPTAHESKELKEQGLDRAALQREGMRVLMRFLTLYPEDPIAPEAGLSLVSAWLSLKEFGHASELAGSLANRFREPRFADSFLYSRAVAEWALGHDDAATQMLERIATVEYADASGRKVPSVNRALAWYILGQIHHARREADAACACYEKVAEQFQDAREALQGIRERQLALPEVTLARPGEKAQVKLTSRNLKQAELLVYPVDLMTLCLREKNLSRIADVNLAGIAPVIKTTVELTRGAAASAAASVFVPGDTPVELGLQKAGAYLLLARAEDHHASGLVLVTPLELQVKEDGGGRVRTHVLRQPDGVYEKDVEVKVIGSQNDAFVAGASDPRGLFIADGIRGTATVLARHGSDEYAFWRGTSFLGPPALEPGRPAPAERAKQEAEQDAYFKNVMDLNRDLQNKRQEQLKEEIRKDRKGVQLKQGDALDVRRGKQ